VLLAERVSALSSKVAETKRGPLADDIQRLKPLAELAELERARTTADWKRRWGPLIILALAFASALSAAFLSTAGPPATEIELESRVTAVSFRLGEQQDLLNGVDLSRLTVERVKCVSEEIGVVDNCPDLTSLGQVSFDTARRKGQHAALNISSLRVPAGSRIMVAKQLELQTYSVWIEPPMPSQTMLLIIGARGTDIRVVRGTKSSQRHTEEREPAALIALLCVPPVVLNVEPRSLRRVTFGQPVAASEIRLADDAQRYGENEQEIRSQSSVISGFVYLDNLNGKRIELRRYERLRFSTSAGEIRSLSSDPNAEGTALLLRYHGVVEGMTRGPSSQPGSLMPNYLELLAENRQLSLARAAVIFLMTAGLATLTIFGLRK
jgi:hypothetical protein